MNRIQKTTPQPKRSVAPASLNQPVWPGLLPWQHLLCAWILGMLAWEWPWPWSTALAICIAALIGSWGRPPFPRQTVDSRIDRFFFNLLPSRTISSAISKAAPLLLAFLVGTATVHLLHPQPPTDHHKNINHRELTALTAKVEEVRPRPGGHFQIILRDVQIHDAKGFSLKNARPLGGKLLWNWQSPPDVPGPGQTVQVSLRIRPIQGMANPGMNRSEDYWARQGIYYRAYSRESNTSPLYGEACGPAWEFRRQLRAAILAATPPGQGQAMLLALLMGDRSLLTPDTMDRVQRASLAHSLALSGMHLGFVVSLGWLGAVVLGWIWPGLYLRLPRPKLAVLLSILPVLGYLWLGQAVPSLLRAALMFGSWGLLLLLNRQRVLLDGLFLALLVILIFSPLAVFDLRLQLSALAVAGLALVWPLGRELMRLSQRPWWQKPLIAGLGILAVSTVATLALLPLQSWYFGRISPHLYLNVLWLPLLGMIVFPLGLTGLLALLIPGITALAVPLLGLACFVLESMVNGLKILDQAGWLATAIPVRPLWPQFLGYWSLLLAAAAWWKFPLAVRPRVLAAALCLLIFPVLSTAWEDQRRGVTLRLLDVSQGQAVLLELPGGTRWLVDGGGFWSWDYDLGRNVISPVLTHGRPPRLDGIALSHAHFDHYRGLYYPLRHFRIGEFASQGKRPQERDGRILTEILDRRKIPENVWRRGDVIRLARGVDLEVLHPDAHWLKAENENDTSLVLRLTWQGRPLALLTGDIEQLSTAALLAAHADDPQSLRAEVLLVPHHGSRSSHAPGLYATVEPSIALVSTGFLNRFNHPHPEVERSLLKLGVPLLNTAEHGAIAVRWNGPDSPPVITSERTGRIMISAELKKERSERLQQMQSSGDDPTALFLFR